MSMLTPAPNDFGPYPSPGPTAWKSIPGFVRFAVWIWSIVVIVGTIFGIIFAIVGIAALNGASQ